MNRVEMIVQLLEEWRDCHEEMSCYGVARAIDALYHPELCPKCGCDLAAWDYDQLGEHRHFEVKK